MIIIEFTIVDATIGVTGHNLRLSSEACIPGFLDFICALHTLGTVVVAQPWHTSPRARVEDAPRFFLRERLQDCRARGL